MTKDELVTKLEEIAGSLMDNEEAHIKADDLLIEYINDDEVKEAFDSIYKWYA